MSLLTKIKARLVEPSTHTALGVAFIALGIMSEEQVQQILVIIGGLLSLGGAALPEAGSKE
jgi:hypothetical protein